jgi:hypothetical protein
MDIRYQLDKCQVLKQTVVSASGLGNEGLMAGGWTSLTSDRWQPVPPVLGGLSSSADV